MNSNEAVCGTAPPLAPPTEKHSGIHSAIQDIDSVITSLDALLGKIQGPRPPEPTDPNKAECSGPTLSEFLGGAEGYIRTKIDRSHNLIGKIREELF